MSEKNKVKLYLGIYFAAQASAILSGIDLLENVGYALAACVVITRFISIALMIVLPADFFRESSANVFWHWTMLFPVFAMAASGWIATAIVYGTVEFVFMVMNYNCKRTR